MKKKIAVLVLLAALIALFFGFGLQDYLTLDYLSAQREALGGWRQENPWTAALAFFTLYVAITAVSLPGAALLTLLAGAVFGFWQGLILVSFASSLGATLAFLIARYLFRDAVRARFSRQLNVIDRGIEKDGAFYLFALRLVPLFPFFAVNLAMAVTPLPTLRFYFVSQAGMLAGTAAYVWAGRELGQIESAAHILSPGLLIAFAVLGLFPLLAKKALDAIGSRRVLRGFARPKRFDANLIVIGAGSGGLVAAYIAAAVKARVVLIERHLMGGDCLNTGCVPSKALLRSAKMLSYISRAREFGLKGASAEFDFGDVMERVRRVIAAVEPHDSVERYTGLGVDCVRGDAKIVSPYAVRVGEREITARNIVVATGGAPFVPPIPGLTKVPHYTSDTLWELRELPRRLIVLGGGPVGCELAQAFRRFGAEVAQVEQDAHLLAREDADVSEAVERRFGAEGIRLLTGHRAVRVEAADGAGENVLVCERLAGNGGEPLDPEGNGRAAAEAVPFDAILVAAGRRPNTAGLGLEEVGVALGKAGNVEVDDFMRTRVPTIYACGDVAGPFQFTHTASHQAWYASVNALFSPFRRFRADYSVIPWTTFTDPEVARVGLNEKEARQRDIAFEVTRYGIDDLDRALADGEAHGFVKVLTPPGKDRILGVAIVGHHAGDLIAEFITAMKWGLGLKKIMSTIHIYPTLSEANRFAAGVWRKNHAPQRLLEWVGKFHDMRR